MSLLYFTKNYPLLLSKILSETNIRKYNISLPVKTKNILLIILLLGFILRLIYFKGPTTFFYDQARDAIASMEIWQNDPLKIMGPQAEIPGLTHGPLYWYLISPFYFFTNGNVWVVRLFLILINCLTIILIYDFTKSLFNNKKVSLLSSFLFAISFEAIQYARWLSNPGPSLLTITLSFWAFNKLIEEKKWALIPFLISLGLSIQLQLFLLYQIPIFLFLWIAIKGFKLPRTSLKVYFIAIGAFLLTLSTFVISEIKFKYQGIKALFILLKPGRTSINIIARLKSYFHGLTEVTYNNVAGINLDYAVIFLTLLLILSYFLYKKNKVKNQFIILFTWIISPVVVYILPGPKAYYLNIGMLVPIIILTSYVLVNYFDKYKLIILLVISIIIGGNLFQVFTKNKEGETLFTVQKQMILRDELKIIDWIYKESENKPFKLNTITSPLFINTTWAYLINWHGINKYGYMPYWWGETQVDVPGSKIRFADDAPTNLHYIIIEPRGSDDKAYIDAIISLEDTRSKVIKTEKIGYFTVEKREITIPRIFTLHDVFYVVKNK